MKVIVATTDADMAATFAVMQQLRPHLASVEAYLQQVRDMQAAYGFQLLSCVDAGRCVGVAGFTVETRLYRGKVLYVADLVTDADTRGQGVGKRLLAALRQQAHAQGCTAIMLDSGTQRLEAHAFYFREGFRVTAFNFSAEVPA